MSYHTQTKNGLQNVRGWKFVKKKGLFTGKIYEFRNKKCKYNQIVWLLIHSIDLYVCQDGF